MDVNFFSFCTSKSKTYFFYFTCSFLQNTHISLSILYIYSIKYSFFYNFLLFSLSLPLSLSQTQSTSLSLSHQPNNNYNSPFHNKITTKHPNNIPFSLSQIFSQTKHFPRFSHKPNNSDLRQIKQNFLKSSHLHHHHHHHTNHHE